MTPREDHETLLCDCCEQPYNEDDGHLVPEPGTRYGVWLICQACYDDGPPEPVTRAAAPREA